MQETILLQHDRQPQSFRKYQWKLRAAVPTGKEEWSE